MLYAGAPFVLALSNLAVHARRRYILLAPIAGI